MLLPAIHPSACFFMAASGLGRSRRHLFHPRHCLREACLMLCICWLQHVLAERSTCLPHGSGSSSGSLTCRTWTDISPATEGAIGGAFLPLKSGSSIAVKLSTGVLVISLADGTISHATFVRGEHCLSHLFPLSSSKWDCGWLWLVLV